MENKKAVISIFSTMWGHKSMGKAVEEALQPRFQTTLNFIKPEQLGLKSYNILYQLFPSFNSIPFKIAENDRVSQLVSKYLYKAYITKIESLLKKQKPKVVISVYFAFSLVLEKLAEKYSYALINVVADPRKFHRLSVSDSAYNLVFDQQSTEYCRKLGIDPKRCLQSGWFVRSEFQKSVSKEVARRSLELDPEIFTVCVIGGSEGAMSILKILPAFFGLDKLVQAVFICGNNRKLFNTLQSLLKIFEFGRTKKTKFFVKGFTNNVHQYLQASDLVIGKAGPNLLFESVAVQRPFLAISHISGQEDGNLDVIKEYRIGLVEENPAKAVKLTREIINTPEILSSFSKPLEKLSAYNQNSSIILRKLIEKILAEGSRSFP